MKNEIYQEFEGLTYEQAIEEAQRCLNCRHKPCQDGCVAHNDIPNMIIAFLEGRGEDAKAISESKTSFPEICGRVCYQDIQCELKCVRQAQNAPVKIGLIERFIGDHYSSKKIEKEKTGKRIAVIGSGPAGLACAQHMIENGVDVDVYERKTFVGGVLKFGIPPYRLPNDVVDQRIDRLEKLGVNFKTSHLISDDESYEDLLDRGYDAVFLGIGASKQNKSNIKGYDSANVIGWKTFLGLLNIGEEPFAEHFAHFKSVVVMGGGNVAMDVAISAAKFGMDTHVVYRRNVKDMPARPAEVKEAQHLNVNFHDLRDPFEIEETDNGLVIHTYKTQLIQNEDHPRGLIETTDEVEKINCDLFVMAIGSKVRPVQFEGLDIDDKDQIIVNENYETSLKGVYAAGDGVTGTKTVIHALSGGKLAAQKICEALGV